jgi:hypothetical protein
MIKPHSDDPDVGAAADQARHIVEETLQGLPKAETFDYGGHELHIGEYNVCSRCTTPIAEAQQASHALQMKADHTDDPTIKEHLEVAAELFRLEGAAAVIRAELHNGKHTEPILNAALGFIYNRSIHDSYDHNHGGGA